MAIPHKHLPPLAGRHKSEVLGLELARLKIPGGYTVPIVATTLADRIHLFYWIGKWEYHEREHSRFDRLSYSTAGIVGPVFSPLMQAPWSHRVGLAAGNGHVFMVYKRNIHLATGNLRTGLFLEGFIWDESGSQKLKPLSQFPVQIPLASMGLGSPGYYLWAGFSESSNQLLILVQTILPGSSSTPALTLMTTSSYSQPQNLVQTSSWKQRRIDDGGFDLDAYLQGVSLHLLYRKTEYALRIPVRFPDFESFELYTVTNNSLPLPEENAYEPLTFRTLKLPDADTLDLIDGIPGGEHPQIHKTDQLTCSVDRLAGGLIRIEKFRLLPWGEGRIIITPKVPASRKVILRKVANKWRTSLLMRIREDVELRNQSGRVPNGTFVCHSQFDELVSIPATTVQALRWVKPHGHLPVHITRYGTVPDQKALEIDILHHDRSYDGLIVSRYRFPEGALVSEADYVGFVVFDINHDQIPPIPSFLPPENYENYQFSPFQLNLGIAPDVDASPSLIIPEKGLDNTMGGSLVAERGNGLTFAAYTDLGDGGTRVIFDDSLPTPNAQYQEGKKMDQASVEGPMAGTDTWVAISQTGEWEDYSLKPMSNPFESGPMVSGLDGIIDTLMTIGRNPSELEITPESARELQNDPLLRQSSALASGKPPIPPAVKLAEHRLIFTHVQGQMAPGEQCVLIGNGGGGNLPYPTVAIQYRDSQVNWLLATVSQAVAGYRVCMKPEVAELAPGNYEAAVMITAGTMQLLVANLNVTAIAPAVILSTPVLNLAGQQNIPGPSVGTVMVSNGGSGSLGAITASISYVSGVRGWLQATVIGNSISVEADASTLTSGIYSAIIQVSASGASASFRTNFFVSVSPPAITRNPSELSFQRPYGYGNPSAGSVIFGANNIPTPMVDNIRYISTPEDWIQTAVVRTAAGSFRLLVQPDMTQLQPGIHEAAIVMSDPSTIIGSWEVPITFVVEPPPSFAAFNYPSVVFAGTEIAFDATPTIFAGSAAEDLRYLWKIEGFDESGTVAHTDVLGPSNNPVALYTFDPSAVHAYPRHRVWLTVTASNGVSREISAWIGVQPSIWDSLWSIHESIKNQELAKIGNCKISFSKYEFNYELSASGEPKSLRIEWKENYAAAYRFRDAICGQGQVDLRLPIKFRSKDISVQGGYGGLFSVDRVAMDLSYGRPFTPGILTVDRRERTLFSQSIDTLDQGSESITSGLAAKPIGNSFHWVDSLKVEVSLKFFGHYLLIVIAPIVALLATWGFTALVTAIVGTQAAIAAALASGPWGWIVAAVLTLSLIIILESQVPPAIESYVERKIRNRLGERSFREKSLDSSGLLTYAGEGLMEEIATRLLAQENLPGVPGRNRFNIDFWQMIFVGERQAKVLIRK